MIATLRRAAMLALVAVALIALAVPAYTHLKGEYEAYVLLCSGFGFLTGIASAFEGMTGDDYDVPQIDIQDPKDWLFEVYIPDKVIEQRFMLGRINREERDSLRIASLPMCGIEP